MRTKGGDHGKEGLLKKGVLADPGEEDQRPEGKGQQDLQPFRPGGQEAAHPVGPHPHQEVGEEGKGRLHLLAGVRTALGGQGRSPGRPEEGHVDHVKEVETYGEPRGDQGCLVHVPHAHPQLVRKDDQHCARGDDLGQGGRAKDDAASEAGVVAVLQHDGQRDEAHGHDARGHDPRGGGEDGPHEDHAQGEPAPKGPEELAHGVQEVLGEAAFLQDDAHEGEEGDGQEELVGHDPKDPVGHGPKEACGEEVQGDAQEPEDHAHGAQGEGHGVAGKEKEDQGQKHQGGHEGVEIHQTTSSSSSGDQWGKAPVKKAIRLMSSESPWRASKPKLKGTRSLMGQRGRPPHVRGHLPDAQGVHGPRPGEVDEP